MCAGTHLCAHDSEKRWVQVGPLKYHAHMRTTQIQDEDDKKDENNDGIADVNQISAKNLFTRKLNLFLITADPQKINKAHENTNKCMPTTYIPRRKIARNTCAH